MRIEAILVKISKFKKQVYPPGSKDLQKTKEKNS